MLRRCAVALLALATTAAADPALDATGRLATVARETRPNCTAVLVAPARALSAGHCAGPVVNHRQKFFTGWRPGGGFDTALPVRDFERVERTPLLPAALRDVLILDLAPRVTPARPLPFGPAPGLGDAVRVVSYPRGDAVQPRDATCTVTDLADTVLTLDCPAASGMSGAPVLVRSGDGWALAAILTARAGNTRSIALLVDASLAAD